MGERRGKFFVSPLHHHPTTMNKKHVFLAVLIGAIIGTAYGRSIPGLSYAKQLPGASL
jgi:hypothetical protein